MNCTTTNVIYCLICTCGKEYIGLTTTSLRKRVTVHKQQIHNESVRHLKVSKHIHECSQLKNPNFYIIPFYKVKQTDSITIRIMESKFINSFKPDLNSDFL